MGAAIRYTPEPSPLLEYHDERHDVFHVVEILAVQALVDQAQGATEAALTTLERAVRVAAAGGFVRPFLDLGAPLACLLTELARRGHEQEYVGRLLGAFATRPVAYVPALPTRASLAGELIES